jgi:hypothetical protein
VPARLILLREAMLLRFFSLFLPQWRGGGRIFRNDQGELGKTAAQMTRSLLAVRLEAPLQYPK